MMKVKICGLRTAKDALKAVELGADILGFVFAPSKRRVTPQEAARITEVLPPFVSTVGVFVNEDPAVVEETISLCNLDYVQLHGEETPDYCRLFPGRVIKAFRVADGDSLAQKVAPYIGLVRGILLDSYVPGSYGGTGHTFNWESARALTGRVPVILAGGLNSVNVAEAAAAVKPWAVDVSSGVETEGRKDPQKIKEFIDAVRRCCYAAG